MDLSTKEKNGGFTLLEILIASFLFAMVLSVIFGSYMGTFRVKDRAISQADLYEKARIALDRIKEDLDASYMSAWAKAPQEEEGASRSAHFIGENNEIEGRDTDRLVFFSQSHVSLGEDEKSPGIVEITYEITEKETEEGFRLYRSEKDPLKVGLEEEPQRLLLCDDVYSLNLTFYDSEGESHESWDSTDEDFKDILPSMVLIQLDFVYEENAEFPVKFMTGVSLRMAEKKYEDKSKR